MANPYATSDLDPFANDFRRSVPAGETPPAPEWPATAPQGEVPTFGPAVPAPGTTNAQFYGAGTSQHANVQYVPPTAPGAPAPTAPPPPAGGGTVPPSTAPPTEARSLETAKFWKIEFYQQFFDVDTHQVLRRMSNVMIPLNPPDVLLDRNWHGNSGAVEPGGNGELFGVALNRKPDMYGPVWICTTLWMLLAVISNVVSKLNAAAGTTWTYNFQIAPVAAIVIYAYWFLMSVVIWGIMKWKNVPVALVDTLCLYGYSLFMFILAAILCAVPTATFQWIVVLGAGIWSAAFLVLNFWHIWKISVEPTWFLGMLMLVGATHLGLTLSFKFYFFNY